jgi:hypothetical protein
MQPMSREYLPNLKKEEYERMGRKKLDPNKERKREEYRSVLLGTFFAVFIAAAILRFLRGGFFGSAFYELSLTI